MRVGDGGPRWTGELDLAIATAREAGALLRERVGHVRQVRFKSSAVDPVTEADKASEVLIAGRILATYPDDRILGEEGSAAETNLGSERLWIVDPLDGTVNFLHEYPVFAVSIALQVDGETQVGVVYDPMRDELFAAQRGQPSTLNGEPITVSDTSELIQSMLTTGFAYDLTERMAAIPLFARFVELTQAVRRDGSAALNVAYVACGRFDGYWEMPIAPWDVAAGALILQEAGGLLSGYTGQPFDPFAREIVASNGVLHPHLLRVIADQFAS
jgi:myo-inositol-1(or 4)-monophosphatase